MTLSLVAAIVSLALWVVLAFVARVPTGLVHLLYAAAIVLFARRIIVRAPRFLL
jgi:hypothetical protein